MEYYVEAVTQERCLIPKERWFSEKPNNSGVEGRWFQGSGRWTKGFVYAMVQSTGGVIMDAQKEMNVESVDIAVKVATSKPTSAETRIHWASPAEPVRADLEQQFEAMRARNWITDRMVQQYQKHW